MKYRRLCSNLSELESKLNQIFSGEEDDQEASKKRFLESAEEIERRLEFLKNQIAAESAASHSPDHQLSRASRRFEGIQSAISRVKNNLDESCCIHGDEDEDEDQVRRPVKFTFYDNPLAFEDGVEDQDDTEFVPFEEEDEERKEKRGVGERFYWRPMLVGMLVGGATVAVAVASLCSDFTTHYSATATVFPPPT